MSAAIPGVVEARAQLRSGQTSARALLDAATARADEWDGVLGVYIRRDDASARRAADAADERLRGAPDDDRLDGIPIGIKDILTTVEGPTTAQSQVVPPLAAPTEDAAVVARLRAAGAVITGKLTTLEYAVGTGRTEGFPIPRNPWDPARWPGGSSAGSAAGVAAGLFSAAIGTDTGGSIRIPAAMCGVSGLMPTFGRVPSTGCVPLGYSLDHIGPIAPSAADCAAVLSAIAGPDPRDPYTSPAQVEDYLAAADGSLRGVRVGVVRDSHFPAGHDVQLAPCFDAFARELEAAGATLRDVVLPYYDEAVAALMLTLSAEAASYHRSELAAHWNDYAASTRFTVALGVTTTAADFVLAQRVRTATIMALTETFAEVDVLVMPTLSAVAPRYGPDGAVPVASLLAYTHTLYWDAVGNPVLAVPMGFGEGGMPLSVQIAGRPFEEALLVRVGDAFQRRTDVHRTRPTLDDGTRARAALVPDTAPAPAAAAPDPEALTTVRRLLADAGIRPSDAELAGFAHAYVAHQQALPGLRALGGDPASVPALRFDPVALADAARPAGG